MTSVKDIARRAGVSPATVSRVLADSSHPVSEATRAKVHRAATELEFRPNLLARALATARSQVFGAIVHDISDPYFGTVVRGLEETARAAGYQLFVCSSDRDAVRELELVGTLMAHQVAAIIFAGGGIDEVAYQRSLRKALADYRRRGGVVVQLAPANVPAPHVLPDNVGGTTAVVRHLVELGHRRIGYAAGPPQVLTSTVRLSGYRAGLADAGIRYDERLVAHGHFSADGGAKAAAELLERAPDLTVIVAASDVTAFGVIDELDRLGVRVPADVSVAGFDDVDSAALVRPRLTTARIPMHELGGTGAQMAVQLLAGRRPRSVVLPGELVVRDSTGPPRKT